MGQESARLEVFLQKALSNFKKNLPGLQVSKKRKTAYPQNFRPYLQNKGDRLVIFDMQKNGFNEEYLLIKPNILIVFLPVSPQYIPPMEKRIMQHITSHLF